MQGRGAKGTTLTAHKVDRVVNTPRENSETDEKSSAPSKRSKPSKEKEGNVSAPKKIDNEKAGMTEDKIVKKGE